MTKTILLLLLLTFINLEGQTDVIQNAETKELVKEYYLGEWIGDSGGRIGSMSFDTEGYFTIEFGGRKLGGKDFILEGEKGSAYYFIDETVKPFTIDLTVKNLVTFEEGTIFGIIAIEDSETFTIALGFDGNRPTEMNEKNSILMKRVIE